MASWPTGQHPALRHLRKYPYRDSLRQKKGAHRQAVAATSFLLVSIFEEHIRASFFSVSVSRYRSAAGLSEREHLELRLLRRIDHAQAK
jgi:hypothetical protein